MMTVERIKSLDDLELLNMYELYQELQSPGVRDSIMLGVIEVEISSRNLK